MSIGSQLKKAREKRQLTLEDVYKHTKILPEMLSALEQDNFARISNPIYLKSFLREYSSYLGLDAKAIVDEYNKTKPKKPVEGPKEPTPGKKSAEINIDTAKIMRAARLIVFFIAIALCLVFLFKASVFIKKGFLNWQKKTFTKEGLKRPVEKKAEVKDNNQPSSPAKVKKKQTLVPKKEPEQKKAEPKPLIAEGEKLELTIKTTDEVWIELKSDNKIVFKNVLKKDAEETWQADENFELWTGNAAHMNLTLNGHDIGSPGAGVVKGYIIDSKSVKQ